MTYSICTYYYHYNDTTVLNRPCLYRPPVSVALALSPLRYHPGGPMAPPSIQQRLTAEPSPTASSSPKQDSHHDDQDDGKFAVQQRNIINIL